ALADRMLVQTGNIQLVSLAREKMDNGLTASECGDGAGHGLADRRIGIFPAKHGESRRGVLRRLRVGSAEARRGGVPRHPLIPFAMFTVACRIAVLRGVAVL